MTRDHEQLGEIQELALLPEEQEEELARALRAAFAPSEVDAAVNEALIAAALEDPLAPPTEEEIAQSERLRRALEGHADHPSADLARALRAAAAPRELSARAAHRLVLASVRATPRARRGKVIYVSFGATAAAIATLAASWLMLVRPALDGARAGAGRTAAGDLVVSRSTAAMFSEKFETAGTTSRVDRIATSRARDLRSNRYALWGVR
jgi:hypothetical protein